MLPGRSLAGKTVGEGDKTVRSRPVLIPPSFAVMLAMQCPGVVDRAQLKLEVQTMSDIGERVKKIVVEHLGVEPDKVVEGASFIDDLGADSLDTVELVMAFEEEFGCEIPDDAAETILTVGDATKFLEKNAKS
jgi:acyl carrier protein